MRWKRFTRVFCGNKTGYETGVGKRRKPYTQDQFTLLLYLIAYGYTVQNITYGLNFSKI